MALASFKSGNKQAAFRQIRQSKLFSESRAKCTSLLERVEEVLSIIADAESTKKVKIIFQAVKSSRFYVLVWCQSKTFFLCQVSEAIQIGTRAIKENKISIEEVQIHLQELDENIASQKQISEALGTTLYFPQPSY